MKRRVSLVLILCICILWAAIPVLAEEGSGIGQWVANTVEAPDVVTVGSQYEKPFKLSQEVIDWWDDIHSRRAKVEAKIERPKLGFNDYSTPPPPSTIEFPINEEAFQPNDSSDYMVVVSHFLSSTENPNVSVESNPSVGYGLMKKGFMVYNNGAARSQDHGRSWTYVSPLIGSPGSPWFFTGKQEVIYDPLYLIHLWVQLWGHSLGGGELRVGVSKDLNSWCWFTAITSTTMLPDDPHIRLGHNFFYLTFDLYQDNGSTFNRSYVQRWKIAHAMRCRGVRTYDYQDWNYRSFMVAKNYGSNSRMYAVSNSGNSIGKIKILRWDKADANIYSWEKTINNWYNGNPRMSCPCLDNHDPCKAYSSYDDRVRAALITYNENFPESAKNQLWVSFNVGKDTLSPNFPYTYLVKIDADTMDVIRYDHIYDWNYAWQNMDMVPNADGDIGMIIDILGGNKYTGIYALILDNDIQDYHAPYVVEGVAAGSQCPSTNKWGHHNSVNLWWRNQFQFTAVGHFMLTPGPQNVYIRFTNEKYFP